MLFNYAGKIFDFKAETEGDEMLEPNSKTQRIIWLDILKTIAMYTVIVYHLDKFSYSFDNNNIIAYIDYFLRTILCIGVPLFFTINGALIISSNKTFNPSKYILKLVHIFIITFIWGMIVKAISLTTSGEKISLSILFLTSLSGEGLNYLWFMKTLITIYVFLPLIQVAFKENSKILVYFLIVIGFATMGNTFLLRVVNSVFFIKNGTIFNEKYNFGNGFNDFQRFYAYSFVYFILGAFLFQNTDKLKKVPKRIYMLIIILCMMIMSCYGIICSKAIASPYNVAGNSYNSISALIIIISIFGLVSDMQIKNNYIYNFISAIGANTLGIYFLHIPIHYILVKSALFSTIDNGFYKLVYCFFIMILALFISCIAKKIPVIHRLFHM